HDAVDALGKPQTLSQGLIFDRLHQIKNLRFAVINAIRDIVQKELNLFDRNQVADVLRVLDQAEYQPDQFSVRHRGPAAVAEVEGGIHLDTQAGRLVIVVRVLDARDDSLRYGELGAARR